MTLPFDFLVGSENLKHERNLNFSFSTGEHGDEDVKFTVPGIVPGPRIDVKLRDTTYGYFWNGYTWQAILDLWDCPTYTCHGWWHSAGDNGWNEKKVWYQGTPVSTVVGDAISKCAHIGDAGLITGLDFQLAEDSNNFGLQAPADVFEYVQQLTNYLSTPYYWRVIQDPQTPFYPSAVLDMRPTDFAPRYRVRLTNNDEFKPIYDSDIVAQVAMITWGNDQYITASTAGYVLNTPLPAPVTDLPNAFIPTPIDYSQIPDMRTRRVRGDNNIKTLEEAIAMAQYLVERNRNLRPIGFTATIDCNTRIDAIPPASKVQTENWPHYLVHSQLGIRILNNLKKWGPYGKINTFYIMATNWTEDGKLQLTLGDPVVVDAIRLLGRFDGSKLGQSIDSAVINQPEKDVNSYPSYGPQLDSGGQYSSNDISSGIPAFAEDSTEGTPNNDDKNNQFFLPFGAGVHPHLVPDYGTQANFGREADSTGIKGFVGLIPVKLLKWEIDFLPAPGSDTVPTDSITIEFYDNYPFTPGSPFATKSVSSAQKNNGSFSTLEQKTFDQGGKVGIRVSSAASTPNIGFIVFLGGRKLYPDLGITS